MSTCVSSPYSLAAASATAATAIFRRRGAAISFSVPPPHCRHAFTLRAAANDSNSTDQLTAESTVERSEADKIVDGMDFGELCNEFECISSPLVESTARQLARDILQLRQGDRSLGNFAVFVKYKDPVRKFTGREKYKRQIWVKSALENPTTSVQEMVMVSTGILNIKWTIKGKPKSLVAAIGGDLIIKVDSQFTLNQISGQVIEHEERWDVSGSSAVSQAFFWASRYLFASAEAGKDLADSVSSLTGRISTEKQNLEMFPDPSGDPTKVEQLPNLVLILSYAWEHVRSSLHLKKCQKAVISVQVLTKSSFKVRTTSKETHTNLHYCWQSSISLYNF